MDSRGWLIVTMCVFGLGLVAAREAIRQEDDFALRYMIWDNRDGVIAELVDEWNARNPSARVKLMVVPWDGYWEKLATMSAGDNLPDVFWLEMGNLYDFVGRGQLMDLTPLVTRDFGDVDRFLSQFQPEILVRSWLMDGRLWGIDRDFDTIALFYNIDLFDEYGVAVPTAQWTWADMRRAAEQLTRDIDGDGRIDVWGLYIPSYSQAGWLNLVWQNDALLINGERTRIQLDSPRAVEALQWMRELTFGNTATGAVRVSPKGGAGSVVGLDLFKRGRLAMTYEGSWMLHEMSRAKGIKWDIEVLPARRLPDGSLNRAVVTNGLADCMSRNTSDATLAWRFMKYLCSMPFHQRMPVIPSRIGAELAWLDRTETPANRRAVIDMLEYARPMPFTPETNLWLDRLRQIAIAPILVTGERDTEETLIRSTARINDLLDDIYERRVQ